MAQQQLKELAYLLFGACFLGLNFFGVALPVLIYFAYQGSVWARVVVAVAVLDMLVPLRPGPKGIWWGFAKGTNPVEGLKSYHQGECIMEGTYSKDKNYLLVYHPHALFGVMAVLTSNALFEKYGIRPLYTGADIVLRIPILRRFLTWYGMTGVSKSAMKKTLHHKYPYNLAMIIPGGISEMFFGLDKEQIILSKRKGFIKLCLEEGVSIVPCYAFGVNEMYTRWWNHKSVMARVSSLIQTSLVFWTGRWGVPFGIIPHPNKMLVVMGEPLEVQQVSNPTREQVQELHQRYVGAVRGLFDKHKHRMGNEWVAQRGTLYLEDEEPKTE